MMLTRMSGSTRSSIVRRGLAGALLVAPLAGCDPEVAAVLPPDTMLAGSNYAGAIQSTSGLLAYFRFSEPSGTTAVDRVKGYRLEAEAGASLGATGAIEGDPEEGAVAVTGDRASRLTMPFPAAFKGATQTMSLELWIKPRGQGAKCQQPSSPLAKLIWVEGIMGAYWGVAMRDEDRAVQFELLMDTDAGYESFDAVSAPGTVVAAANADCSDAPWQQIVTTFDARAADGNLRVYVDGELKRAAANPLSVRDGATELAGTEVQPRFDVAGSGQVIDVDSGTLGEPFDGFIDELSVYSRALSEQEVRSHFVAAGR